MGRKKKMSRKPRYKSLVILSGIRIIFDLEPLLAGYEGYAYLSRRPLVASNPLDKFAILSGVRIDEA